MKNILGKYDSSPLKQVCSSRRPASAAALTTPLKALLLTLAASSAASAAGTLAGVTADEPLLTLDATVTTTSGNCGSDDADAISVYSNDTVKFCYTVSNTGTQPLYGVNLVADNGTPADPSDDFTFFINVINGLSSNVVENLVTMPAAATTVVNTAKVTSANDYYGDPGQQLSATDAATVELSPSPHNSPVAHDDSVTTRQDTPVTLDVAANDTDLDDNLDAGSVTLVQEPTNGTVTNHKDGSLTYTPNPGFLGDDSFGYQVCDVLDACDSATVSISVEPVNTTPVANDDTAATNQDTPVTIDATANDTDQDDNLDSGSTTLVSAPANGSVTNHQDGTFTYTPAPDYQGYDSFDYQVCDSEGACDTATVTVTVNVRNNRSITVDLQDFSLSGTELEGAVLLTNQSGGYDVKISDMAIGVEYKLPKKHWTDVAVNQGSCTFEPGTPFLVVDQQDVTFSGCELTKAIPAGATVRVTANVKIFGRFMGKGKASGWFLDRLSN